MRVRWSSVLIVVVVSLPVLAHAEAPADLAAPGATAPGATAPGAAPAQEAPAPDQPRPFTYRPREIPPFTTRPMAIGVNNPIGWYRGAVAASVYVGLSQHHAIRANFAYYGHASPGADLVSGLAGGDLASYRGRVIDYGAALVWYTRPRWRGTTLEIGALVRDRAIRTGFESEVVKNWTLTYGARGMIGYSWRIGRGFVAFAVGLSAGYERGRERIRPESFPSMSTVEGPVARVQVDGEGYLRIGWVLGD